MLSDIDSAAERFCEAAFVPELWVSLLDDLAVATGSGAGGIGIYWPQTRGIRTSFEISSGRDDWEQSPAEQARWVTYVRSNGLVNGGFSQLDPYSGDWSDIPDFGERFSRHIERGFGVQVGTITELFNGEIITLEFTRRHGEPRYSSDIIAALNGLNAAFRQATFFASRLQFERARGSIEVLNDVGLPAALLGSNGQILLANDLFEGVDRYFARTPSGQLSLRGSDVLRKTFAHALELSVTKSVSVPIPAGEFRNAAVIHLMPLYGDARSIFSMSGAVLIVAPVATAVGVPSPELVSTLFKLTPAEARLAVGLASGLSLRDSAANQAIMVGTARAYLNSIFSKTRTSQQSALVSLLKSISPVGNRNRHVTE